MRDALTPTREPGWTLQTDGFDVRRESSVEARFAISNGFLGVRAARSVSRGPLWLSFMRGPTWTAWPRTYVAGLFDTPETDPPVPALVPAPDWLRVRIALNGEPLRLRLGETLQHQRTLDLRRGLLISDWRQRTPAGSLVQLQTLRLVSLADRAIGLQLVRLAIDGEPAEVTFEASFEAAGLGMETLHLEPDLGWWRATQGGRTLAMAGAVELSVHDRVLQPSLPAPLTWRWNWLARPGEPAAFVRLIAAERGETTNDDPAAVRGGLARATAIGWRAVLTNHAAAWATRWSDSDVVLSGDAAAAQALRFAVYHLNSAANPEDTLVSIGARALTGDSYLGHVFWDTEIYLLPFYSLTWPAAARALLLYRHHTLPGARKKAAAGGWHGAMYAWESADTGEETTPDRVMAADGSLVDVLSGRLEHHITADVAFAVWQYWLATADDDFLRDAGAEILLETARFWSSRACLEADGRCHIRDVIGPDEYHEHVDDNAFTNVMARWNIRRGLEVAEWLQANATERWVALAARIELDETELAAWRNTADALVTGFDAATGLFEQFAGYFRLEDIDLAQYGDRKMPMDVVLGRARTQASQVVKQADVVALLALRPEPWSPAIRKANFEYYAPRCGHGSSLSRAMHAIASAQLGDAALALRYFHDSTAQDLSDATAGAAGGVHIAALGGLWQVAMFGFAGLQLGADNIGFDPVMPEAWQSLQFAMQWRGRKLRLTIDAIAARFRATLLDGLPMPLLVRGTSYPLSPGQELAVDLAP